MTERDPRTADRTASRATPQGDGADQEPTTDAAGTTGTTGATSGDALEPAPDPTAEKSRGRKEPPDGSKTSMSNVR